MSARLSRQQVADVAALAHLDLTADELDMLSHQLAEILEYVAALQEVDTTGVAPTASVGPRYETDRSDDVRPSLPVDEALAAAPDAAPDEGLFKVPRVIG
jgi:aspartyl-tRNA(Asn)/glutamyl-tRNA(Gln) amidotransferase subunit C